jgi:Transposase DDE domain group 1
MFEPSPADGAHPPGESGIVSTGVVQKGLQPKRLPMDLHGRRVYVEWDPYAPVTPLGQLVYFSQFLATAGLFSEWVADCPLRYTSPNAPSRTDVLGTATLAILAGNKRYAHVTALRGDTVNAKGLGMTRVLSEDALRRAFADEPPQPLEIWQRKHLLRSVEPVLKEPWICDVDVTIKPVYGHPEGAQVGYNPHKPGRPAHAYHTFFVSRLRLALDVVVAPGKQFHSQALGPSLWSWWEKLERACRPELMRFDCGFGNEGFLLDCEQRQQRYLGRLRLTKGVKELVRVLSAQGAWQKCEPHWEGKEAQLRLKGWSCARRVVVLRRPVEAGRPLALGRSSSVQPELIPQGVPEQFEYVVLVTNTELGILSVARLYRERADSENPIDELKRQWGWGGFVTRDLVRCQVAARNVALIYNWWSLFVRCADPCRPREAVTSRPLLLYAVGRQVSHAGQTTLVLTSTHARAQKVQELLVNLSLFLSGLKNAAEQLSSAQCWQRIWERILTPFRALEAACRALFGQEGRLTG